MTFTKLPKAISAEELLSTPLPPVKWIIPGLLPAGLALFAGPSKAGKSWLTLWLCLQISQGNPVWNREIEPRTVIYFSLEDTFNRLQNRIFQLIDGGDAPERLILQTECPSIGQGLEEQVEALVHTYHDVGLIVIDRKNKVRLLSFYGDDGDGGDDDIDITQLSGWGIPERPSPSSPSSLGALEGSKHGRSVAAGQHAEKPTGTTPNPCEAASA